MSGKFFKGGEISMNFSGVFKTKNSLNVRTSLFPLKLVERFLGCELIIFGGVTSFGPPVGGTIVAQAMAYRVIDAGINNFNVCSK
jgi:hypothetical protein